VKITYFKQSQQKKKKKKEKKSREHRRSKNKSLQEQINLSNDNTCCFVGSNLFRNLRKNLSGLALFKQKGI
jgi:hypothetical protein